MRSNPAIALALSASLLAATAAVPARAAATSCESRAGSMADAMGHHDYAAAAREMDDHMRQISLPTTLPSMWDALMHDVYGPYRSHGQGTVTHNGDGTTTVTLPLQFERAQATVLVTCDPRKGGTVDDFILR